MLPQLLPYDEFNRELESNTHPADWKNPQPEGRYNLVVVGGGTAGLVTAAVAAGLGARTALIERDLLGGDCLNVGCVPSKGMISAARAIGQIRKAASLGVTSSGPLQIDFEQIMRRVRALRAKISPHDSAKRFSDLGVDVYFGRACFTGKRSVKVSGGESGDRELVFKKACIATGGRAGSPEIPGLKDSGYLTNETLFSLTTLPSRLAIVGGGPIGVEMAQAFSRFGSQVVLVERSGNVLSREDPEAAQVVQQSLLDDGIEILANSTVESISGSDGEKTLKVATHDGVLERTVDEVLVAVGRIPNVDGLGLESAGVDYSETAGIQVNDQLQTTNGNVFAAGDVASRFKFTHAADFMARAVIQNALFPGPKKRVSKLMIPWATYTSPELAHVGLTRTEADAQGVPTDTFTQYFKDLDRAILDGETDGFVRIHVKKGRDQIVGATVVGPHAGDLIGEISMAMTQRIGLKKIASAIHPYPTYAEAIRKLGDAINKNGFTDFKKRLLAKWFRWTR